MLLDPEHIVAIATELILDHARTVPLDKIQAVVGEQFNGLDHVDRAILADRITEAIATADLTVGINTPIQRGDRVTTPDGPGFVFAFTAANLDSAHVTLDGQNRNVTFRLADLTRVED